ncbi:MAG: hypothetical protein ACXVC1_05605 [Tumebacillaceae bacterium]
MNKRWNQKLAVLLAGVALIGVLSGCGNSSTAAATSGSGNNGAHKRQGQGQGNGGMNFQKTLQDAGISADDAKSLMQLARDNHVQMKWLMDQIKNKVSVATITDEIKNGKAPKATQNGNGNWQGKKGDGGNGNGGNANGSPGGSDSNSGSSTGTSN